MPKVCFVKEMITVDVPTGTSLRDVAIAQGIELYRGMWTHLNCRGNGICGRCRLWVLSPGASRRSLRERIHRVVRGQMRLACQVRVEGDLEIHTRPLGPPTVRDAAGPEPSYRQEAEKRMREARAAAEKEAAEKAAAEKAAAEKAAAEKAAAEKAAVEKAAPEKAASTTAESSSPPGGAGTD